MELFLTSVVTFLIVFTVTHYSLSVFEVKRVAAIAIAAVLGVLSAILLILV
jgi:hypothetical protein